MAERVATNDVALRLPVVEARISPPRLPQDTVIRRRIIEPLKRSTAQVVIVTAPAGYGKTTLVAQWAQMAGRPTAWLSVDDADQDPTVLLAHVASSIDKIAPLGDAVFDVIASPASSPWIPISAVGAAISRQNPFTLVLDDLHVLSAGPSADAVASLADHLPLGGQLVVAARSEPPLPIARLRASGRLVEIDATALCLDDDEAVNLLERAGAEVERGVAAELNQRAEGWAAALYLGALAMRAGDRAASISSAVDGSDLFVADYLASEVLDRMDSSQRTLLRRTSILDRLSGPLCDAVMERTGSAVDLESLARSNSLVVPLDRAGEWYRCHQLLREALVAELKRTEPDVIAGLTSRAVDWYVAAGHSDEAIEAALRVSDHALAARHIAADFVPIYNAGRVMSLLRWVGDFETAGMLGRYPSVPVVGVWVAALTGDASSAWRWLAIGQSGLAAPAEPDATAARMIGIARAGLARDGVRQMLADAQRAVEANPEGSPFRPAALDILGIALRLNGNPIEADEVLEEATVTAGSWDPSGASLGLAFRAVLAADREAWGIAETHAKAARDVIVRAHLTEYPLSVMVYAMGARLALRRGNRVQGLTDLAHADRLRPATTVALPWLAVQTRLELARCRVSIADAAGAHTVLRELDDILVQLPDLGAVADEASRLKERALTIPGAEPGSSSLTSAELRLLPYLATHLQMGEIASRLGVSRNTVKTQAVSIYRKLDATSRSEAVEQARRVGLVDAEEAFVQVG